MSTTQQHRTRAQRVASRINYVGFLDRMGHLYIGDHGVLKIGVLILSTLVLCLATQAWNPPFAFRQESKVERNICCRTPFSVPSNEKTEEARQNARMDALHVYVNDGAKLAQFKAGLVNTVQTLLVAENFQSMKPETLEKWRLFLPPNTPDETAAIAFEKFQKTFETDVELAGFKQVIDNAFRSYEKNGILIQLHGSREGNQERILVCDVGTLPESGREVPVLDVLIGNAYLIKDRLNQNYSWDISELLFQWIRPAIPETLSENQEASENAQEVAAAKVDTVYTKYEVGQPIAKSGTVLDPITFHLLKEEYKSMIAGRTMDIKMVRGFGVGVLIFFLLFLSYIFIMSRNASPAGVARSLVGSKRSLGDMVVLYGLIVLTILVGRLLQVLLENQGANPELIPLLIFAQIATLIFSWEEAIFTSFIAAFILAVSGYFDLGVFLIIVGTVSVVIVLSRDIRTRSKIIFVTLSGAITAFLLSTSIGLLMNQPLGEPLFLEAGLRTAWTFLAGILFAGLLPFAERLFGVMTPMRLVEIGNPSHPLLIELARRAPATYNHSIQVASIAEAAAESIGARAALVRVGAYFHDIGKMINPLYFTENQERGSVNIHDSLEPRVSTLVIVSHVKDGVDLARQYHLPQEVIDLIEQHHGTMLVSYFYEKANGLNKERGGTTSLEDGPFRYPGPRPRSKEAGILMLADAVESACRSLGEVSPGRIENLVRDISAKRMEDGQFDEAGLTLGEIRVVENSIITSILASRHSRIKYPEKENKNSNGDNGGNGGNGGGSTASASGASSAGSLSGTTLAAKIS
ncbi:MAG: HDIG domain-containing protein [Planctomycetia bacterium]|nr:HDIG domain-containing protein [Planctomycetia bacterium]